MSSLADRLKFARERAGLTLQQVEDRTSIGRSSLSEYENGKREPRMGQLSKLAAAYHRSMEYFFSSQPFELEGVLWRDKGEEQLEIETEFLELCRQYRNLEMWCDAVQEVHLPTTRASLEDFSSADVEELAKDARKLLDLGYRPGVGLRRTLEEVCGIKIFYREFEGASAASTWDDSFGPAILLNSRNKPWRRTYDLAHELFHLITWKSFRSHGTQLSLVADEMEEDFADEFASHFLMPAGAIKSAVNSAAGDRFISIDDLEDVARQFDVSTLAVLYRARHLFNLDWDKTRDVAGQIKARHDSRAIHAHPDLPHYPRRYMELAVRALRKGEVSLGRFADYVELSRNEARKYLPTESDRDAEIEIASA